MDVIVYGCRSDELLLVPSCMQPSLEAEHRYGPLVAARTIVIEEGAVEWQAVANQIDGSLVCRTECRRSEAAVGCRPSMPVRGAQPLFASAAPGEIREGDWGTGRHQAADEGQAELTLRCRRPFHDMSGHLSRKPHRQRWIP